MHWHAINTSLSPDNAAQCIYPTRVCARNTMNRWLRDVQEFGWTAVPVGVSGWDVRARDGTRVRIDVVQCDKPECQVKP